ncbi:SHOCT domain-containing protein [Haloterrigena alkaliphila]|uniref:SHOCT domain-containing protein n=1 Tax=Haloterrigena alkaliphila TaxID=2816475 RepID=A0A8A2VIW3_9EURY|nr:SHOCT domain-containing protein [Haloterrigena alkaliphila]QSX00273.1 SHOCT domain-containing protein [Haloterrigena alkaliphila]
MARLGTVLLKGAGVALLALLVLGAVATVVSIVLSIVATVVAAVVTMAILAVCVLAVVGLVSLLRGDEAADADTIGDPTTRSAETAAPTDRLRSRYVDGELSEAEFERELDRLLEADGGADRLERDRTRESTSDRSRLRDR